MSDFKEFMERFDRAVASVERELAKRHASSSEREASPAPKPHALRAVALPALVVSGLVAAIWVATR